MLRPPLGWSSTPTARWSWSNGRPPRTATSGSSGKPGCSRRPAIPASSISSPSSDRAGEPALVTRWAGSQTLDAVEPCRPCQAAGILVAVADCVADLHDLGIVHRTITADHVMLTEPGHPSCADSAMPPPDLDDGARTAAMPKTMWPPWVCFCDGGWRRRSTWNPYRSGGAGGVNHAGRAISAGRSSRSPTRPPTTNANSARPLGHWLQPSTTRSPVPGWARSPRRLRSLPPGPGTAGPQSPSVPDRPTSTESSDGRSPPARPRGSLGGAVARRPTAILAGILGRAVLLFGIHQVRSAPQEAPAAKPWPPRNRRRLRRLAPPEHHLPPRRVVHASGRLAGGRRPVPRRVRAASMSTRTAVRIHVRSPSAGVQAAGINTPSDSGATVSSSATGLRRSSHAGPAPTCHR